jgi:hypothetical protein
MGVVGLVFNDASWDGSNAQLGQICFYGLAFQWKVNRMYNIHQLATSQWNASVPVSSRDMTIESIKNPNLCCFLWDFSFGQDIQT